LPAFCSQNLIESIQVIIIEEADGDDDHDRRAT
jgi:hypothetical protein